MKKTTMILSVGLSALVGASVIAGCGGPRKKATTDPFVDDFDASKEYTINFFGWGDDQEQDIYKRIIKDFEAQYPNVHVKYDATAAGEYLPALTGKIDSLPDVFYLPDTEFLQWADSGRLLNLLDAEGSLEDELSAIWENAVNEYYYNPQTYTLGKSEGAGLYALPKDQGPYTLGYNKTLMTERIAANHLQNDEEVRALLSGEPVSWAAFISAMDKLLEGTADDFYGIPYYELEHAVYSNNATFFDETVTTSTLTSPAFVDAVQFIGDLVTHGIIKPQGLGAIGEGADATFYAKKSLMTFVGPWDFATIWKNDTMNVDILPVPYGPGPDRQYGTADDGKSTAFIGSMGYCIPEKTVERGTAGASLRLAKYLAMNESAQRKFYAYGQCIPNLKSMAEEYVTDSEHAFSELGHTDPENRKLFIDIVDGFKNAEDRIAGKTRTLYYTYNSDWRGNLEDTINLSGLYTGAKTAQQVLEGYNATFQSELDLMNELLKG